VFFHCELRTSALGWRLLSGGDFKRKSLKRSVVRDAAPRVIGRHGALTIFEVRDERGRKALRYVRESPCSGGKGGTRTLDRNERMVDSLA
jgi:hypothetical protein